MPLLCALGVVWCAVVAAEAAPSLVCFGDSTTAPRGALRVYPQLLADEAMWRGASPRVFNAGRPGDTTEDARERFQAEVIDRRPDIAVIAFGINDSAVDVWKGAEAPRVGLERYEENLRGFVRALRAIGTRPVLMTPNPLAWTDDLKARYGKPPYDPDDPDGFNAVLRDYADGARRVARDTGAALVDVYALFEARAREHPEQALLLDGMHPNDLGHRLVADALLETLPTLAHDYFETRGGLENCRLRFLGEKRGRVVYMGGSITTGGKWRPLSYELLRRRFPETEFEFIDAGIGGTDSTLGAFRFEEHVFGTGRVDLLFLEYAVNDAGRRPNDKHRIRAMEGIIRHARRLNPEIDILIQYFVDTGKVERINAGEMPWEIADHDRVAGHYGIPVIDMAKEMTRRLNAGEFTWEQFSSDTCHPTEFGHERYTECLGAFLDVVWAKPPATGAQMVSRDLPDPVDPLNYQYGRFIDPSEAEIESGWFRDPAWQAEKTCNYGGPVDVLTATEPGATLRLAFNGTLIGFYGIAGMDAGIIEYRIDDGDFRAMDLFDAYCDRFHRPVCHLFAEELPPGEHVLTLRMTGERNEKSLGSAMRILKFTCN